MLGGLKVLGLTGHNEGARRVVHAQGHSGREPARGVHLGEGVGEGCCDLSRLGVGQAKNPGITRALVGSVEIEDQCGDLFEVVGPPGDDEAVALGVGPDDRLLRRRNRLGLQRFFVQRANRARQFSGLALGQIQHPSLTRSRGCGGRLDHTEESFDFGQVVGPCGDQNPAIGSIGGEHRIGRVRGVLILPPFGIELTEQGKHPDHFIGLTHGDGPSLKRSQRGGVLLELFEDGVDQGELSLTAGQDELVARGVVEDEQVGQGQVRLVAGLVVVKLAYPGRHFADLTLTQCHHLHAAVRTGSEGGIELLDDGGDRLQFFGIPRDDEGAAFGIHGNRGPFLGPAEGVVADECRGQHFGDFLRFGGADFEHPGRRALGAHLVELANEVVDDGQFIGLAHDDEAVAARVGGDGGVWRGGAKAGFGLIEVEGANRGGQFRGGGGGQVDDPDVPGVSTRLGRAGSQLLENGFDLLQVVGASCDNDAAAPGVAQDLGVGWVGVGPFLPLVGIELLEERLHPLDIAGRTDFKGACFASEVGAAGGLQVVDDFRNAVQMRGPARGDDASGARFGEQLGVGGAIRRAAGSLVFVELLDDRQ